MTMYDSLSEEKVHFWPRMTWPAVTTSLLPSLSEWIPHIALHLQNPRVLDFFIAVFDYANPSLSFPPPFRCLHKGIPSSSPSVSFSLFCHLFATTIFLLCLLIIRWLYFRSLFCLQYQSLLHPFDTFFSSSGVHPPSVWHSLLPFFLLYLTSTCKCVFSAQHETLIMALCSLILFSLSLFSPLFLLSVFFPYFAKLLYICKLFSFFSWKVIRAVMTSTLILRVTSLSWLNLVTKTAPHFDLHANHASHIFLLLFLPSCSFCDDTNVVVCVLTLCFLYSSYASVKEFVVIISLVSFRFSISPFILWEGIPRNSDLVCDIVLRVRLHSVCWNKGEKVQETFLRLHLIFPSIASSFLFF